MKNKVFVISNNYDSIQKFISFTNDEFEVKYSCKPWDVRQILQSEYFSCILFDICGIEDEAFSIVKRMRSYIFIPIVIIAKKEKFKEVEKAMKAGADDFYFESVANVDDLVFRIKIRTFKFNNVLEFDKLIINKGTRIVTYDGNVLPITNYEFDILSILASNVGYPYTKKDLYKLIWHMVDLDNSHTVHAHISTLRKKLIDASGIDYIKTYWKKGYLFDPNGAFKTEKIEE